MAETKITNVVVPEVYSDSQWRGAFTILLYIRVVSW